jgi:hypothetical protein
MESNSTGRGGAIASIQLRVTRGFAGPRTIEAIGPDVTVGRSKDATLRFDPQRDLACSSGIHARLRHRAGRWEIECLHRSGLRVLGADGTTVSLTEREWLPLDLPAEIELGKGGPRFEASTPDGPVPATTIGDRRFEHQPVSAIPASMMVEVQRSKSRTRTLAISLLAMIACIAGVVWMSPQGESSAPRTTVVQVNPSEVVKRIEEAIEGNERRQRQVIDAARNSVWLVGCGVPAGTGDVEEDFVGVGTAWTLGDDMLATNAHVAIALRDLVASHGGRLQARRPGRSDEVLDVEIGAVHPAYERWDRRLRDRFVRLPGGGLEPVGLVTPGDVAILKVIEGDPGTPLVLRPLARDDEVRANQEIVAIGYPMQGISGPPTLQSTSGTISNVTDPFHREGDGDAVLLHHTAFTVGGASGGPMLDEEGEVVGLVTAINAFSLDDGKVVIPTGLNYGTHVRMLHELMNGDAEPVQGDRDPRWEERLRKTVASDREMMRWIALGAGVDSATFDETEVVVASIAGEGMGAGTSLRHDAPAGSGVLVVALAPDRTNIDLQVLVDGRVVGDTHPDCYPVVQLPPDGRDRRVQAVVYTSDPIDHEACVVEVMIIPLRVFGAPPPRPTGGSLGYDGPDRLSTE